MSKSLFALSEEVLILEADLEREDLTDEQRVGLVDAWLEAQGDVAAKLDNYAAFITELEARAGARNAEARRLGVLAHAEEQRAASLKERLKLYFQAHEMKKFETTRYKLALQANGGKQIVIIEVEPEQLPEEFHRVVPARIEADRDALRTALEDGLEVAGVRLGERGSTIRIR